MVSLAKTQKCLSCVKKLTFKNFIFILCVNRYISDFILQNLAVLFYIQRKGKDFCSEPIQDFKVTTF
jgi:hypothetical protein